MSTANPKKRSTRRRSKKRKVVIKRESSNRVLPYLGLISSFTSVIGIIVSVISVRDVIFETLKLNATNSIVIAILFGSVVIMGGVYLLIRQFNTSIQDIADLMKGFGTRIITLITYVFVDIALFFLIFGVFWFVDIYIVSPLILSGFDRDTVYSLQLLLSIIISVPTIAYIVQSIIRVIKLLRDVKDDNAPDKLS